MQTYSELRDYIEQLLQDSANEIWTTAELDLLMADGLKEISQYVPVIGRYTLKTTADSKDLDISLIKEETLYIDKVEFRVNKDPKQFRNFSIIGDMLTMDIDFLPGADEDVYLYCAKIHRLPNLTDFVGAVNTAASKGATSLVVKNLQTSGTFPKNTEFMIDGIDGIYTNTEAETISGGIVSLSPIYPGLAADVAVDTKVTIKQSTLTAELERLFADLVAAKAALSKSIDFINKVNIGAGRPLVDYHSWGTNKLTLTLSHLRRLVKPKTRREYPKD